MDAKNTRLVEVKRVWSLNSIEHSGAENLLLSIADMRKELSSSVDCGPCDPLQVEIRLTTLVDAAQVHDA